MKKHSAIKKIIPFILTIILLILAIPFMVSAADPVTIPLIAGQDTNIGYVRVSDDGTKLTVEYQVIAEGWYLTQTHLYVGLTPPSKSAPGKFPFSHTLANVTYDKFEVPITDGTKYYIAAHATAAGFSGWDCPTPAEIAAMLPACGHIVGQPGSIFDVVFTSSGILDGTHTAWCVDATHSFAFSPTEYTARFFSSLSAMPDFLITGTDPNIDYPQNLDLVNWVLNNKSGFGRDAIQNVIWHLLDANPPYALGPEQSLYDQALTHDGFMPDFCAGQVMAVIVAPVATCEATSTVAQVIMIEISFPCTPTYSSDTAWGQDLEADGYTAFKTGWGNYFNYTP